VPLADGPAEDKDGLVWLLPFVMGDRRLVDRLRMSLPFTTRLSLDLRRSFVIISAYVSAEVIYLLRFRTHHLRQHQDQSRCQCGH
jgi:hypothetical protein